MNPAGHTPSSEVHPSAQPFFHPGNKDGIGVVLVHGLTASPTEVQPIADHLINIDASMTLSCPLLPGHGTSAKDLRATSSEMWMNTVQEEVNHLADECSTVHIVGVSLGAVLAAAVALRDARVRSIALLAPVFDLGLIRTLLVPIARHFVPYVKKSSRSRNNHRHKDLFSYDRYPLDSVAHVLRLARETRSRLHQLQIPVLLAMGRHDRYVSPANVKALRKKFGENLVEFVDCQDSGHVLPHEPDAPKLLEAIARFLYYPGAPK